MASIALANTASTNVVSPSCTDSLLEGELTPIEAREQHFAIGTVAHQPICFEELTGEVGIRKVVRLKVTPAGD